MIIHYFPRLYELFINSIHPPDRYDQAGDIIGNGSVLDIGCGTGLLADHLSPGATYQGIDLNKRLLNYARGKGLNVSRMDCKNVSSYPEVDVYFICDLLHHINPDHRSFIRELIKTFPNSTVVVCEPYARGSWIYRQLVKILDYDYVNGIWRPDWYEKKELYRFLEEEVKADRIEEIGNDLVGVRE
ncbi:MAG: class I SAM-dependent methyltransferase [Candidatus Acetothermia bacterium]